MPGPWNDTTDKQLLLAIIHLTVPGAPQWNEVAAAMGEGYTAESTRQHFAKLKKEAKAQVEAGGGAVATPAKKSPVKRGGRKAVGDGGKAKGAESGEGGDDEEESPVKKYKGVIKDEEEDDDERV